MDQLTLQYTDAAETHPYPIRFEARQRMETAWAQTSWSFRNGSLNTVRTVWIPPAALTWTSSGSYNEAYVDGDSRVVWNHMLEVWISSDRGFVEFVKAAIRERLAAEGKPDPYP